ncbi:hypothetical protein [Nocardia sp. NPDC051833]|uniref:hypothetical protein n=1 Tax=Nocardia sp. NPDC051833 TaxID=3155674 RepID=UPI00341ED57B
MTTDPLDEPIYTRRDMKQIGYALLHVPHTAEIEFADGQMPAEPTPELLLSMLDQLAGILRGKMAEPTGVEQAVWAAWGEIEDNDPAPVKRIARQLGMTAADVAFVVYPVEEFGRWDDSQEPDLDSIEQLDAGSGPIEDLPADLDADGPWMCDACDESAEVLVVHPSEHDAQPHPLCAEHLVQFGRELIAGRGD